MCPAREGWAVKLNSLVGNLLLQFFKPVLNIEKLVLKEVKAGLAKFAFCNVLLEAHEQVRNCVHLQEHGDLLFVNNVIHGRIALPGLWC